MINETKFQGYVLPCGIRHDAAYNTTDSKTKSAPAQQVGYEAVCIFLKSLPKGTDKGVMVKHVLDKFDISQADAIKYVNEHVKEQS